jgi:hypothetical protein
MDGRLGAPIQVGWVVEDLDRAMLDVTGLFDVREWRVVDWPDLALPDIVSFHRGQPAADWRARMAFGHLGSMEIELVENLAGASTYAEWLATHGPGVHHLMYAVDDIVAVLEGFAGQGIGVLTSCGIASADGYHPRWAALDTGGRIGVHTEVVARGGLRD